MGCTSAKSNQKTSNTIQGGNRSEVGGETDLQANDHQNLYFIWQQVQKLSGQYSEVLEYIQKQRQIVYEGLYTKQNMTHSVALAPVERYDTYISIENDLAFFRSFKRTNKAKYETFVQRFINNIKYCVYRLENITRAHSECLALLNQAKQTPKGAKFAEKHKEIFNVLNEQMHNIAKYLEIVSMVAVPTPESQVTQEHTDLADCSPYLRRKATATQEDPIELVINV